MNIFNRYKIWKYKNTSFLVVSLVVFFYFLESAFIQNIILRLGEYGYLGAFIVGVFFVSTFTVAPSLVVLYYLATVLNPWEVAVLAGLGAVLGDFLIFKFFKDAVFSELEPHFKFLKRPFFARLFGSPYFAWLTPFMGAVIIASPLPDELGLSLLGLSKIKTWEFFLLAFVLNSLGIFIIVSLPRLI
jgi:hypothetical protein